MSKRQIAQPKTRTPRVINGLDAASRARLRELGPVAPTELAIGGDDCEWEAIGVLDALAYDLELLAPEDLEFAEHDPERHLWLRRIIARIRLARQYCGAHLAYRAAKVAS